MASVPERIPHLSINLLRESMRLYGEMHDDVCKNRRYAAMLEVSLSYLTKSTPDEWRYYGPGYTDHNDYFDSHAYIFGGELLTRLSHIVLHTEATRPYEYNYEPDNSVVELALASGEEGGEELFQYGSVLLGRGYRNRAKAGMYTQEFPVDVDGM